MRVTDARLAIPAAVAWSAAFVAIAGVPLPVALALWLIAASLLVAGFRWRWLATPALAVAAAALVTTVAVAQAPARHPAELESAAHHHRHVTLLVDATQTAVPGSRFVSGTAGSAPVLVFADFSHRVDVGERIEVRGTLQSVAAADDVSYLVFADDPPTSRAPPPWWLAWSADMRASFGRSAAALPGDGGALLPGLAIGDTTAVDESLSGAMKASSLTHLTAVSGANCAIIVAIALVLARTVGLGRRSRAVLAIALLLAFVALVTPQASVLRAAVMAVIVLVSGLGGRGRAGLPLLSLAVIVLLAADPWLARDYGFALSVLATGALVTIAGPLARVLARIMPDRVALLLAIPISAQLVCQPVLVLLQPTIPVYGVVANMLAEPAAPMATVVGLAACALGAVSPAAAVPLDWIAWLPSAWIAAVAHFFAGLPANAVPWLEGVPGLVLLAVLTAAGIVVALGRGRRVRVVAASVVAVLVVVIGSATIATRATQQLSRPTDWQIAGCDVGQGDAFVIRSAGRIALVDTGREPGPLAHCLDELGIGRIDLLVLTHYDLDHVGGASAVVGRVGEVLVGPISDPSDVTLHEQLADGGAHVEQATRGMRGRLGDLDWQVLWPPVRQGSLEPGNDSSVTVAVSCAMGCLSGLFLGDLGEEPQARLLALGPLPRVDVVKVAHHGSADQDARTYAEAGAAVGAIGVGIDNEYGHPTDALLAILASVGSTPVRTDLDGLFLLSPGPEPGTVSVWTEKHVPAPG
jgi:competence protein ComEC